MVITIRTNHHRAYLLNCPTQELRHLDSVLCYQERSSFYQRTIRGFPPRYKRLLDLTTNSFPKGLVERVALCLQLRKHQVRVEETVPKPPLRPFSIPDWAYPHQVRAVQHLLAHPHSALQSPTGSGKTIIGAMLLGHIQGRCMVVVPTKDLLNQTASKLEQILGEPIGRLGSGKCEWQRVNVGIINTLSNLVPCAEVAELEAVIYDEAHRAIHFSRYGHFAKHLARCYYQWGLTAGAHREDGADLALEALIGPTKMVISEREIESLGLTLKPQIYFIRMADPKCDYPGKYTLVGQRRVYQTHNQKPELRHVYQLALVENQRRNQAVQAVIQAYHQRHSQPVLVLVESVEHGTILAEMLQAPFIHGASLREERQTNLAQLQAGEIKVTVATRVYNEGVDIPKLGMVINAAGGCSRQQVRQKIGRGVRSSQGKTKAIIVDFLDEERYYLHSQAQKRLTISESIYPGACEVVELSELCELLKRS